MILAQRPVALLGGLGPRAIPHRHGPRYRGESGATPGAARVLIRLLEPEATGFETVCRRVESFRGIAWSAGLASPAARIGDVSPPSPPW